MPSRTSVWIAALALCAVVTIAAPKHPALRIALLIATFCLFVGTIVNFINKSSGPEVVPGSRSAAQLSVDIDQISSRLAELQERGAAQEANMRSIASEIQNNLNQFTQRYDSILNENQSVIMATQSQANNSNMSIEGLAHQLNMLEQRISAIDTGQIAQDSYSSKLLASNIHAAADDVVAAKNLIPTFSSMLEEWRTESARRPTTSEIAARDNFLNERLNPTKETVSLGKDLIDVSNFDHKVDSGSMENHISNLIAVGEAKFSSQSEIKSWARSQARVIAIEESLDQYLTRLHSLVDFAARVHERRNQLGNIPS